LSNSGNGGLIGPGLASLDWLGSKGLDPGVFPICLKTVMNCFFSIAWLRKNEAEISINEPAIKGSIFFLNKNSGIRKA
jgi:hypothetical protein